MLDFYHLTYLQNGSDRQRMAFKALSVLQLFDHLAQYQPLLAGTIPLGIDLLESDLDIICCFKKSTEFKISIEKHFSDFQGFQMNAKNIRGQFAVIAKFQFQEFPIEIFGQAIPSDQQMAFQHMLIEYQLLKEQGEDFKQEVIRLKKQGLKTEPAFAKLLGLKGDPYEALLKLKQNLK